MRYVWPLKTVLQFSLVLFYFVLIFFLTVIYSLSRDKNEASKENQVKLQLKKSHEGK